LCRYTVVNAPAELRPIYAQMQAAKRSQAPDPVALRGDDVLLTLTDAEVGLCKFHAVYLPSGARKRLVSSTLEP
jgi:hypothetical protein